MFLVNSPYVVRDGVVVVMVVVVALVDMEELVIDKDENMDQDDKNLSHDMNSYLLERAQANIVCVIEGSVSVICDFPVD